MRVRSKPVEYEAFQMSAAVYRVSEDWPEWLYVAKESYGLALRAARWWIPAVDEYVDADDWILRDPGGALSVLTPAEFAELEVSEA